MSDLENIIYKRQSHRDFYDNTLDNETLEKIKNFILNAKPLFNDIETKSIIVGNDDVNNVLNWTAPYYIAIFSENKKGYLTNIGFIYQQVDLYLQSLGLGSVWLGMGRFTPKTPVAIEMKNSDYEFCILIAFGKVKSTLYRELSDFQRKELTEIADKADKKLEVAKLAPSAMNNQPWYFTHTDDYYNLYCAKHNIITRKIYGKFNKIDIGIALAHLYITNKDTFETFSVENPAKVKGYDYVLSFKL